MVAENNDEKVVIARIQNRRGLKQDLPQPLRPGEIGFAVDSRQVFIGGDPCNPQSADFNNYSYFEQTVEAETHTASIANNNILVFTVPFVKYQPGEFNGLNTIKQWQPTDARSIISQSGNPECKFTSADFPVFSTTDTDIISSITGNATVSVASFEVDTTGGIDTFGNIRVGDIVTGDDIVGTNITVQSVATNPSGGYIVTVNTQQTLSGNSNVSFTPVTVLNITTNSPFKSSDVIVKKNGIQLVPESDPTLLTVPSATADFTIDASNVQPGGFHKLTLRSAPSSTDEVTLAYYSNVEVIRALDGVNGKIASQAADDSFYDTYNVPWYRQIDDENIHLSTTSGTGFIGLELKHITSSADGSNIATPMAVTLGNLMISRDDVEYATTLVTENANANIWDIALSLSSQNDFSPIGNSEVYAYNRLVTHTGNANDYFDGNIFDVLVSTGTDANVQIAIPNTSYQTFRNCNCDLAPAAEYAGNDFTDQAPAQTVIRVTPNDNTLVDDVRLNDWIRIFDATGFSGNELHDTVFNVQAIDTVNNYVDIKVNAGTIIGGNAVPAFTANTVQVSFANHGATSGDVDTVIQLFSENNALTQGVSNVTIITDATGGSGLTPGATYTVDTNNISSNAFFITDQPTFAAAIMDEVLGTFRPTLPATYATVTITPVLAIDLSANTTVSDAMGTVNKSTVSIPAVDPASNVTILPELQYLPQADGELNAVFITQRPSFTSIDSGGLDFTLYEDYETLTLAALGITPGSYTRENSSIRAKLETWMNGLVNSRDSTLFTEVALAGPAYATLSPSHFDTYDVAIDSTFGEIAFCSREEAEAFNEVVNKVYANSLFDRNQDDSSGTRGLVNIKNNIELATRQQVTLGQKIETYPDLESVTILQSDDANTIVFSLDTSTYDAFVLDYTISETSGQLNKYNRIGTMVVSGRPDFPTDPANSAIFSDSFTSQWDVTHSDPFIEPQFDASLNGNVIEVTMTDQFDANVGTVVHTIGSSLSMKYTIKRWSST